MTLYFTSPGSVDPRPVLRVLEEFDQDVVFVAETAAGASFARQEAPGPLIAVLPQSVAAAGAGAVLLELGIALGMGRRVLLLREPGTTPLTALRDLASVTVDLSDLEQVRQTVQMFVHLLSNSTERSSKAPEAAPPARTTIQHGSQTRSVDLEQRALDAFSSAGALVARAHQADREFDLVLTFPGSEDTLGVVLVEMKSRRLSLKPRALQKASEQLQDNVLRSQAGLGLLVVDAEDEQEFSQDATRVPFVLTLSIEELDKLATEGSLLSALRRARNKAVHGL